MRVSVVIPCYNSLRFLPETLDAVLAQDLPESLRNSFEVVLIDDGGSDALAEWATERGDDRVRVVRQPNAGVSAARNLGIASSTGDLIAFCDSDDLWSEHAVASLAACFDRDPRIGLAYGWYDVIDADGRPTGRVHRSDVQGQVWEQFVTANPVAASAAMVSRAALEDVGDFAVNRDKFPIDVEDWELWIRIAARWPVGLAASVLVSHRRHDANSSTDVDSLEAAYTHLLEVVFADVGPERALLRPAAAAQVQVRLAWHALNDRQDPRRALGYLRRATASSPEMRRSGEYWRLRVAAFALSVTGENGYRLVRSTNRTLRRVVHRGRRFGRVSPASAVDPQVQQ